MKERIESMLKLMEGAQKGTATPPGLKQLLKDLCYPCSYIMIEHVRLFLQGKLSE
ncbi:MAG: hypothetical protein ABUK13_05595 [Gammaproteobacteria bacterium]